MIHVSPLAKVFLGKERSSRLRDSLMRAAVGTFGLKVIALGLSFVVSLVLARSLGVVGYGIYSYAMALDSLLSVLATFGLDRLLTRNVAAYRAQSAWGLMSGLLRWANQTALMVASGLALLVAALIWTLAEHINPQMVSALWIALFMLPLTALVNLKRGAMHGLNHVVGGQLMERCVRPLSFILMVGLFYLGLGGKLSASWAVGLNVIAMGVALLIGIQLLHRTLPLAVGQASPVYQTHIWVRSALPLMFIGILQAVNSQSPILLLGAIKGAEAVAFYNVAQRGAQLITFILAAVNISLAPTIASLYAAGHMQRVQSVVTKSARAVLFVSLPVVIGFIIFGEQFLSLFGRDFTGGHTLLIILSIGHLIDATAGSVGLLLVMTRHEHDAAIGFAIRAVLEVMLGLLLIPKWGAEGAATATAISLIIWNILLVIWVYKRLGIHSTALGRISLRTNA
jgi:O-antigen/teichoic acid export membrane protein